MRVRALKSFVSRVGGNKFRVDQGQELEMPKGADWLKAGFVEPVKAKRESASVEAPEKAVAPKARKKKAK